MYIIYQVNCLKGTFYRLRSILDLKEKTPSCSYLRIEGHCRVFPNGE